MSETEIVEYVRSYADRAHGKQLRKYTGERYIGHPVRVMKTVGEYYAETAIRAAALLHDVLEDTPVTAGEMEEALRKVMEEEQARRTVQLVIELTDIFIKKHYPDLHRRARKEREAERLSAVSAEAQSIKYADIIDNVTDIVRQDADFATVFVREAKKMLTVMQAGNADLRQRAMSLVDRCLLELPDPARRARSTS